ncbi:SDR family NAD(P)-dependent oxidoreductase [Agrococcus sp. ARC_14]|uniref:SDR family NAD(P)-dependent oxidoreductase n=1 Tax=Agrococcus sp. ARC_14 TaxID=2919927 RepID=UPI001F05A077|nr:SDR family NAD(P)-dependent oxidoreductase [Agrococcus sp. ARC_14]MCH1882535.1 SDR family NAD(P)-dependent oxidoreductase [Agrococcus sp. ARC_14]
MDAHTPTLPADLRAGRIPSQAGRTWLVTGATNGIGREVVRAAASAGARVIVPARSAERGAALEAELRGSGAETRVLPLDLADLASVRAFADALDEPVDVLVNNAGAVTPRRRETRDGFELVLGTNLLGPFALTCLIAERVRSRIVVVGSGAHRAGYIDAGDPHFRHRRWSLAAAYAQSKLGDMLWARALQRRLQLRGSAIDVQLAHPGWSHTNIQNVTGVALLDRIVTEVTRPIAQPPAAGALPLLAAAVAELPPLTYLGPDGWRRWRGQPAPELASPLARDDSAADALWALCVRETGVDLPR